MKRWPGEALRKKNVPVGWIPGLMAAIAMGWTGNELLATKNLRENKLVFPNKAVVEGVIDGDSFFIESGQSVRLIGVNAPDRGEEKFEEAKNSLVSLVVNKNVWLEYDRYQDDKFGRILAWIWIGCENEPKFLPADYMHLNKRQSRPGLTENPEGCKEGKLINEELVKNKLAVVEKYKDRGELKYEARLRQ